MPARLEYEITGNISGLVSAASQTTGILNNLQKASDGLNIKLFSATSKSDIDAIGGALTIVNTKIQEYLKSAVQGSQAFKDAQAQTALDNLATKITVLTGNSQLFGESIKNSQAQINAYQGAINSLLSNGFGPMDTRVVDLKGKIDLLTKSIEDQKNATKTVVDPFARFQATGGIITDIENRLKNLTVALKGATNERDIVKYNIRLEELKSQLRDLNGLGSKVNQSITATGRASVATAGGVNSFNLELSRVIQDAPFAANNFGAIGNNITRAAETIPQYIAGLRATIVAQGGVATSSAVMKAGLTGLFTGFSGIVLAISLAVSAFTVYQQIQQKNAREAENQVNLVQKQKTALDNYISTLNASQRATAKAADSYAEEVTKLDILYTSLIKNQSARYGTVTALQELQKSWPEEFGNLQKGVGFTDQLSASYRRLRENILQTGIAAAAQSLSADATKKLVENTVALTAADAKAKSAREEYNKQLERYQKITSGISSEANALAGQDVIARPLEQAKKALDDATESAATFRIEAFKARQEVGKFNQAAADAQNKLTTPVKSGLLYDMEQQLQRLQSVRSTIKVKAELDFNTSEIKRIQAEIDKLGGAKGTKKDTSGSTGVSLSLFKTLSNTLDDIFAKTNALANQSGLEGYALEVQKVKDKYVALNVEIDRSIEKAKNSVGKKGGVSTGQLATLEDKASRDRKTNIAAQDKELSDLRIAEALRVSNEVQRINDAFGVKAELSRAKELAGVDKMYNAEVEKAKQNAVLIAAAENGRLVAKQAINEKYLLIEQDLQEKILQINNLALATIEGKEESRTAKIENEWETRRIAANKYFEELKRLAKTAPDTVPELLPGLNNAFRNLKVQGITNQQAQTNTNITGGKDGAILAANLELFNRSLQQGVKQFANSFYSTLENINSQADATFGSIFNALFTNLTTNINKIFINVLEPQLAKLIENATKAGGGIIGADGKLTAAGKFAAGAGIAGGLISGITPKNSVVGQAAGGALSGAATGAAIGSIIPGLGTVAGGVIGGAIGLISGIFGASKAQKELQERQLAEQKQQTELMKQSIAYTSSIIGRVTANGVVTGVTLGATGQLVATVSGKDLQFVLDRTGKAR